MTTCAAGVGRTENTNRKKKIRDLERRLRRDVDGVGDVLVEAAEQRALAGRCRHKNAGARAAATLDNNFGSPSALKESAEVTLEMGHITSALDVGG